MIIIICAISLYEKIYLFSSIKSVCTNKSKSYWRLTERINLPSPEVLFTLIDAYTLRHMPHGITLHLALKNSNYYFSEAVLPTCQHQVPQALTATTAHRNIITSLQVGPLSRNFLHFSCHHWCTSHNLCTSTKSIRWHSHLMTTTAFSYFQATRKLWHKLLCQKSTFS